MSDPTAAEEIEVYHGTYDDNGGNGEDEYQDMDDGHQYNDEDIDEEDTAVEARYNDDASSSEDGEYDNGVEGGDNHNHNHNNTPGYSGIDVPMTVLDAFYGGGGGAPPSPTTSPFSTGVEFKSGGGGGEVCTYQGDTNALSDEEFAHLCDKFLRRGKSDIEKVEGLIARFDSTKEELQLPTTDAVLLEKYILDPVTVGLLEFKDYYDHRLEKAVQLVRAMRADAERGNGNENGNGSSPVSSSSPKNASSPTNSSGPAFNMANRRRSTGIGRLVTTETGDGKAYVTIVADNGEQMTFSRPATGTNQDGSATPNSRGEALATVALPGSPEGGAKHQQNGAFPSRGGGGGTTAPTTQGVPITDLSEDLDLMVGGSSEEGLGAGGGGGGIKPLTRMRCVLQLVKTLNILIAHREATLHVLETISTRESALNEVVVLAEANERGDAADDVEVAVILHRLLYNLQRTTLSVIDAITKWREGLCVPRPFVCGFGHNYIHKIVSDCKELGELPSINRSLPMQQLYCRYPLLSNLPSISLYALQKEAQRPFKAPPAPQHLQQSITTKSKGSKPQQQQHQHQQNDENAMMVVGGSNSIRGGGGGGNSMGSSYNPQHQQGSNEGSMVAGGTGATNTATASSVDYGSYAPLTATSSSSKYKLYSPLGAPPVDPAYQRRVEAAEMYIHSETDRLLAGVHTLLKLCSAGEFLPVANIAPVCPTLRKQVVTYNQSIAAKAQERAAAVKTNATGGGGGVKPKFNTTAGKGGHNGNGPAKKKLPKVTTRLPQPPSDMTSSIPPFRFTMGVRIGNRELQEDYEATLLEYISVLKNPPFRGEYDEWCSQEAQKVDNTRKYKTIKGRAAPLVPSMSATMMTNSGNGHSHNNNVMKESPTASPLQPLPPPSSGAAGRRQSTIHHQEATGTDRTIAYRRSSVSLTGPLVAMPSARQSNADAPKASPSQY